MKSFIAMLLLASSSLFAAEGTESPKHVLVREVLTLLDSDRLTRRLVDTLLLEASESPRDREWLDQLSGEDREKAETMLKQRRAEQAEVHRRVLTAIDYAKIDAEIYEPLFARSYSEDELRQLVTFLKTPLGKKFAATNPELLFATPRAISQIIMQAYETAQRDMAAEERARAPKWKLALSDIRSLATANEARATDVNEYSGARDIDALARDIEPTYIRNAPKKDPWGNEYAYIVSADKQHYRFVSAGADGSFEWDSRRIDPLPENFQGTPTDDPDADIIYQDGQFVRYPRESNAQ